MSQFTNLRYSITLNDVQLDYLSDEQLDILRMNCLKTFIRLAVLEETKVSGKNYSAVLQPGQFKASKVELARLWGCDRKTATRIVQEFNHIGILRSESSNRTTKRVPPETAVETDKSGCSNPTNPGGAQ